MEPGASSFLRNQRGFQILEPMDFYFPNLIILIVAPNENILWEVGD